MRVALISAFALPCAVFSQSQTLSAKRSKINKDKEEYFLSGRVSKVGDSAAGLASAQREKVQSKASRSQSAWRESEQAGGEASVNAFAGLAWQSLGPRAITSDATGLQSYGLVTGRVTAIAVDRTEPNGNRVFIGTANGGIWKSTNAASSDPNAVTWQPLTDYKETLSIGSLAIQPGGSVILAGTGEPNSSASAYYGQGILVSTDNGATWNLVSAADGGAVSLRGIGFGRIAFNSLQNNVVVAAAGGTPGSIIGAETSGSGARTLYVSNDSGQHWTKAIVTDVSSNDVMPFSATAVVFSKTSNRFYAAMRYHGFYQSSDGFSWTRMPNQPGSGISQVNCPTSPWSSSCPMYRADLTVREDTGEVFAVWVDSNSTSGGIFRLNFNDAANPGDDTWTALGTARIDDCGDIDGCGLQQAAYNLTLKAVPNGLSTDLYLGAVNLFKCTMTNASASCSNASDWKNLTHAYGCEANGGLGAPAHVHPNQHAIDFGGVDSQRIFFGNDGGVYRTLTALQLANDSCSTPNPFDNLNANLGSLAQVVDFSNHPTDSNVILSGVQSNGSPAFNGASWTSINGGDGGYTAIDPASPNTFYTAADGVGIFRCTNGVNCDRGSWSPVVSSEDLGTDGSAFFMPYQLDPQKSSALLMGTCRVWRGVPGNGFTALSQNFSTGDDLSCTGGTFSGETKVRSLAAGGAPTGNGSSVIYAGMGGFTMPSAGKIFVTTSANSGTTLWSDRTGDINPFAYDIADIAVSPHDSSGNTAYIAIMGFGAAHVFKTTNAGQSWTNKSGDLPDVPVSAIVVDPVTPTQLYAGTDVGVFVSLDDGATWNELGNGLPNTAVTKLKIFRSGSVKKLRAGTYGRGIWEIPLPGGGLSVGLDASDFVSIVNRRSDERVLTVTNNTASAVSITGVNASGDFILRTNACPGSLPAGASCSIGVVFAPVAAGTRSGGVTVNYTGGSASATLQGIGIDFGVRVTRSSRPVRGSSSAAMLEAGQSATFEVETSIFAGDAKDVLLPMEFACENVPARVKCLVETSAAELKAGESRKIAVKLEVPGNPRKSVRLRNSVRSGEYYVTFVAKSGEETRAVPLGFRVK